MPKSTVVEISPQEHAQMPAALRHISSTLPASQLRVPSVGPS
jgi:hypothetical protein